MADSTIIKKRKSQREAVKKRQQQIYILVGIVMVAVVAVIGIVLINRQSAIARQNAVVAAEGGTYEGVVATISPEEGMPQLGSDDAPVTVHVYSSFSCGHCANFHDSQLPELMDDVLAGKIRIVYVPVTGAFARPASAATFCAGEQGKFWEMQDIMFGYLRQYSNSAYQADRLFDAATLLELDRDEFEACMASNTVLEQMNVANGLFQDLATTYPDLVTGTPTITFNGEPTDYGSGGLPVDVIDEEIAALLAE